MPNSTLLEIALGLVFIFTLFSLLVSAANEIIVALLKSRAVSLWDGIGMLLDGNDQLRQQFFDHPLIRSVTPPQSWGAKITSNRRKAPSYIETRTFAVALLDLLKQPHGALGAIEAELKRTVAELRTGDTSGLTRASTTLGKIAAQLPATPLGAEVKQHLHGLQQHLGDATQSAAELARSVDDALQLLPAHWLAAVKESAAKFSPGLEGTLKALAEDAAGSIESFRQGIERWFDEGMARVSGWYKRWTQAVQFGLGLVLAIALNIDTVNIVRVLEENEQLRRTLAARAEAYAKTAALDPRNVIGQQSSGPFTISLQSPDAQTFELKSGLPSDLPSDVKFETLKVTATPSEELAPFEVRCEKARQDPKSQEPRAAVIPCTINQRVLARRLGVIKVGYEWIQQKNKQPVTETRAASIPIVLVPDAEKQFEDIQTRLKETGLPLGWRNPGGAQAYLGEHHIFAVLGWLLTALAVSLGAPFWFDLLKKVANLRAAGPSPDEKKSTPAAT